MMLEDAISCYQEPTWKNISNIRNPLDHSCDNSLLFSSTYVYIQKIHTNSTFRTPSWWFDFVEACALEPGLYTRYPKFISENRQDDLTGISAVGVVCFNSPALAVYNYGKAHNWSWNVEKPGVWTFSSYLRRFAGFVPAVKAAAGVKLHIVDILELSLSFIINCFESRGETSGKCLLYLRLRAIQGKSRILDFVISRWKKHMFKLYPGGMRDVYAIYFGPEHPFALFGPSDFDA